VHRASCRLSGKHLARLQQQRRHDLPPAAQIVDGCLPRANQITHRLMPFIRHPDCRQFAGAQQARQLDRVAPVGFK
jgi:hypothetical protein